MTTNALTWPEGGRLRVVELAEGQSYVMGRAPGSAIMINDNTVSRQQALVKAGGAGFVLENLSGTNPTRVNGNPAVAPVFLGDGDQVHAGTVTMVFHDLAAIDRLGGPVCSHCGRENGADDKDCWYCGTSLVNAPTTIRNRQSAVCRLVAVSGARYDLYATDALVVQLDGSAAMTRSEGAPAGAPLAVTVEAGRATLRVAAGTPATVNGGAAVDGYALRSGDEVTLGAGRFTAIVR